MNQPTNMSDGARHAVDVLTWLLAAFTVGSFWHGVALAVTIMSGVLGLILGGFRLHDRIKYGPAKR